MRTQHDARDFILKLPKAVAEMAPWQTAIETLLLAANGGPMDFGRIGMMQAGPTVGDTAGNRKASQYRRL